RAVVAQEVVDTINYTDWQSVAERAEASVAAGLASDKAFESLRSEVVVWRERFLRGQDANAQRIRTLRAQLVALGPPPAEGETEAEEVANRRRELNASLAEALAPVKTAEEAFSRAEGLVREIDGIIRARQTDALLKLAPSPLNPALWPDAVRELVATLKSIGNEVVLSWRSDAKRIALRDGLPKTLLFLVVAVVLLARGRFLMEKLTWLVLDISKGSTRALAGFATSLGQIIVPVLGIYLLVEALQSTGMLGLRGLLVTDWLPLFGLLTFGARWLGLRLFPKRNDVARLFDPTPEQSRTIRLSALLLGILVAAGVLITTVSDYDSYTSGSSVVLIFPIAALVALVLTRVGRVLRLISRTMQDRETPVHGARGVGLVGRAVMIVALAGLVLSAIGYINAGLFLLFPTTFTLGLLGILLLLNELIRDIYAFATRKSYEQARAALVPTLFSIPLILAALPVFALIWGARVADLTELLAKFREGFTFGDTRISPGSFLTFAIVFAALYGATRLVQGALKNSVLPKTKMDIGGQTAIVSGIGYVGIFLAALIAINSAGLDLSSLAIVAGALSVGIGFGLQNIVQNFVSGIILLIERPVAEGDWIEVGGHVGTVRKISVRSTLIETFDRTDVIVPNGDFIAGAVTNWTRTNLIGRIKVPVGVAYGTNTRRVEEILREIANEHPLVTITPEPGIDFLGFGADSLDFQIRAVLSDVNFSVAVRTEMNHRIAERFAEEGIEIPFAQRDIWLRNPEALTGIARPVADPPAQPAASTSAPRELGDSDRELDPTLMSDGGEGEHT
ncbi:MAG: DUF3772 domain-containing protein, partial [Rhodobacter sp.]|nr:DUF3772 domain-containing protein [Rhodobacter sp.]